MDSSFTQFDSAETTANGHRSGINNRNITKALFRKHIASFSIFSLGLCLLSFDSSAANRYSAGSGNWSSTSTWSTSEFGGGGASVPVAGDVVLISGGNSVTVDVATAACGSIQLGSSIPSAGSGTLVFNTSTKLTVSGNITLGGGSSSRTGTVTMTNGGLLQCGGSFTAPNLGAFTEGTGTVEFNGTAQTVPSAISPFNNLTLSGSGIKTTSSITVNGTLSLQGTATVGNTVAYGSSAILEYKGSAAQTTSTNEFLATMAKVVINNANGVALNAAKTISGTLTLTSGKLDIGNNTLTMSSNATTAISGANSSNYIIAGAVSGKLRYSSMTQGTAYSFPIGNSSYYLPVTVNPLSGTGDFSAGVFQGATMNGTVSGTAYDANAKKSMIDAIWDVSRNSGTTNATISLQWDAALEGSSIAGKSGSLIGIGHYTTPGPAWQMPVSNPGNTTTQATATFTSFSPFSVSLSATPLAIVLNYFTGSVVNGNAVLQWATGNDDARLFNLEKSADGKSFETIAPIVANSTRAYEYKDPMSTNANNYYRLKMEEANGDISYSNVVNLKTNKLGSSPISIAPNPAKDVFSLTYPLTMSDATINIVDMQGRIVYKQVVAANTDQGTINISSLPAGIYVVRINDGVSQIQQLLYHL
ncbi:T9SS type A sorting domain-containing protein [Taibaiella soli]|uniref:Secretion system C-terminal sorting domain-containing protein n=1 Tax=Taibaiella soli TaxID=1649169 RepID=A0A2W2BU02_9BACT|nr:T9SS type A sorting domain-containing protein [Taibaiella soli]PZF71293.1 hypothetical protein DN068_18520 [Taibaiella soli]